MDDGRCLSAEAPPPLKHINPGHTLPPALVTHDKSFPNSSEEYSPLPPGCWTLGFHGNCPKCHHHNRALQVQVRVTEDDSQVSYVHCERCQDRWAAFAGRNTTRISLLSTVTNEPDLVERGVRYSLVDIVKLATAKASLGPLPEISNSGPSQETSVHSQANDDLLPTSLPRIAPSSASHVQPLPLADAITPNQLPKLRKSTPTNRIGEGESRKSSVRLISSFRKHLSTRFPILHEYRLKYWSHAFKTPPTTEKTPVRSVTATCTPAIVTDDSPARETVLEQFIDQEARKNDTFRADIVEPCKRMAEVVSFIASLDKSVLDLKSGDERAEWMRKEYTKFKLGRKRPVTPLSISPVFHTSIPGEGSQIHTRRPSRISMDLFGVGTQHDVIESLEAALRSGSITISETSEVPLASDATFSGPNPRNSGPQLLDRLRRGLTSQRPRSLPTALPSQLRPEGRNSREALLIAGVESNASIQRQVQSRFSQGSTLYGSTSSITPSRSGEIVNRFESSEHLAAYGRDPAQQPSPTLGSRRDQLG